MGRCFNGAWLISEKTTSPRSQKKAAERLGFLHAESRDKAFAMSATFVTNPEVHVVPSGGVILPVVEESGK